jgi:hypothetical protein
VLTSCLGSTWCAFRRDHLGLVLAQVACLLRPMGNFWQQVMPCPCYDERRCPYNNHGIHFSDAEVCISANLTIGREKVSFFCEKPMDFKRRRLRQLCFCELGPRKFLY